MQPPSKREAVFFTAAQKNNKGKSSFAANSISRRVLMDHVSYSNAVEEIKSRCNIVDVVSPLVPLKRSGVTYSGC